eukprot:gene7171-7385_t
MKSVTQCKSLGTFQKHDYFKRGKNLQLLQPQHLHPHRAAPGTIRPSTNSAAHTAILTRLSSTPLPVGSSAVVVGSTASSSSLPAPDASNGPLPNAGTFVGHEQVLSATEPAVVSAATSTAAADTVAQVAANLTTPPAVPHALAVALPTPVSDVNSSKASDIVQSAPAAQSPGVLAGGVSSQQMALACNSMCSSPSGDVAVGLHGAQLQLPASLESPDACLSLKLPGSLNSELHQPVDLDSSKVFGSAQKRLRLSLGDEQYTLASPILHLRGLPSPAGQPTPSAAAAVGSAAAGEGPGAGYVELATPSKFFSGSPVPLAARKALQGTPETPGLFGHAAEAATPPWLGKGLHTDPASCPLRTIREQATAVDQPSSWVPVAGGGTTPAEAAVVVGVPAAGCFSATPASNPVLVPVRPSGPEATSVAPAAGVGPGHDGSVAAGAQQLVTPPGREQPVQATPVTEA